MIQPIARILAELRARGLSVSTPEGIDAARALQIVGLESRDRLRAALRATLAKGVEEGLIFDEIFDRMFVPPSRGGGKTGERDAGGRGAGGTGRSGGGDAAE